jgi:16S rRNA (adenine1518-N6/adenine1519-N6)-dimethyltransferase
MVIMVQKEVGELIAASPGDMGFLSVMVQFYSKPTIVAYVPATSFYPPPRVDSVILRLDVYSQPPIAVSDVAGFFDFVKHGFSNPRKQLRNSLAHSLQMVHSDVVLLLEKAGIDPRRRAETLSLEEWGKLWDVFLSLKQGSPC